MTAPTKETSSAVRLNVLLLMVGPPSRKPPIIAPIIPTTILSSAPCWPSVRITILASQPTNAPNSSHRIRLITVVLLYRSCSYALWRDEYRLCKWRATEQTAQLLLIPMLIMGLLQAGRAARVV